MNFLFQLFKTKNSRNEHTDWKAPQAAIARADWHPPSGVCTRIALCPIAKVGSVQIPTRPGSKGSILL